MELAFDASVARREHERARAEREALASPSGRRRFEEILRRHHRLLRRVAAGILLDQNRVDDVLQEAYLKAFRGLPGHFANEAHEAAWLHRVVYHCCLDELRRRKRRPEQPGLPEDATGYGGDEVLGRIAVEDALAALSPPDRAVLLLVDLVGLDYEAAAAVLEVPRGTVASRLNGARGRFREVVGGEPDA